MKVMLIKNYLLVKNRRFLMLYAPNFLFTGSKQMICVLVELIFQILG